MEKLIELFCHVIRITDPLSIQIAVGMIGGGIPLLFLYALFILVGELASKEREATTPVSHNRHWLLDRVGVDKNQKHLLVEAPYWGG